MKRCTVAVLSVALAIPIVVGGQAPAGRGGRGAGGGPFAKVPGQLASGWNAPSTVARTTLRHEWVDIPVGSSTVHTWIEYPNGDAPAGVVVVMSYEAGLDDWIRSVADELAASGFIALAPDVLTGLGPNGGNYDALRSPDEVIRAIRTRVVPEQAMRQYLAAATYGATLPRANGRIGSVGFGPGGTFSFRFAAEAPVVHAAVVFYGVAPDDATLRKITVPVLGFYGEDDPAVTGTVAATAATLQRAGKSFEHRTYPGATHHFGLIQVEGRNGPATQDAWTRTLAFFKEHLQ
ncbi:MAG: dienelactone hydrolase family protein [Acidimicrobiia bacterium]|nr:dienelactone hydrolase family protein [Acidimicrobiia bacterium]